MKKIAVISLAIVLMYITNVFASGELINMTTEELMKLQLNIQSELMSRREGKSVIVPPGRYVVGEDIPAGVYTVTIENASSASAVITVFPSKRVVDEPMSFVVMEFLGSFTGSTTIGKLELSNEMFVEISGGMLTFDIYVGLGF